MIVELHGASLGNKGAELMLRTALEQLSTRVPDFQGVVFPTDEMVAERVALGLRHILPSPGRFNRVLSGLGRVEGLVGSLGGAKYARLLRWYGLVDIGMVDALVDLSGFRFADTWGPEPTEQFLRLVRAYKRRRAPVVMLPQALGPFDGRRVRKAFRGITAAADVIFARDVASYEFAAAVTEAPERLHLAPDITLFDDFRPEPSDQGPAPYCCLVPNARVIDRAGGDWAEKYGECLVAAAKAVLDADVSLKIVLHTNEAADLALAERVAEDAALGSVELVTGDDAYALKRVIAGSRAVVGSRYHSLVSAFSQGVPAVALGWSHKYTGLFGDFGMRDLALDASTTPAAVAAAVSAVLEPERNAALRAQITGKLDELSGVNARMWATVETILRYRA